jgi:hypothetical protein
MIKRYNFRIGILLLSWLLISTVFAQPPANGENEYRLGAVNPRFTGLNTITSDAGRGVWVAHDPDLDNDGKPEILVTEYTKGGRVFVYEFVGNDQIEFIWASKILDDSDSLGTTESPRSVTTGDFDNNGIQEIIFPIGYFATDSTQFANRGIYFYEWTGNDNDFGTEPTYKLTYESIDSTFATMNVGRTENGLRVQDIDGDGKNEMLFPPRSFNFPVAKLYILQINSGTFAGNDAVIDTEYVYTDMVQVPIISPDGYVPMGTEIGDVDNNGLDEIIVAGFQNIGQGIGLGFIQINGPDSYTPGSIVQVSNAATCCVKDKPIFTKVNGEPVIYLMNTEVNSTMYIVEGIFNFQFVSPANVHELFTNVGFWSSWALGDQDHPTNDPGDGLDIYVSGDGPIRDIEYNGSGNVTDTSSYTVTQVFDLADVYDNFGGGFHDFYTYPGMDLDNDGLRDFVASWKGSALDTLAGVSLAKNGFHVFFFEWGDSSQSINLPGIVGIKQRPLTIIMPDDYELEQNFPNPFNSSTAIRFSLPINKVISLKIYNALGQEVRTLINNQQYSPGSYMEQWDGKDNNGNSVATGVYVYTLKYGNFSKSKKMSLIQ